MVGTGERLETYRRIFRDTETSDPENLPFRIHSGLSGYGLPAEESLILKKVLSYYPEKFSDVLSAETMVSASAAVSSIA